MSDTFAAEFAPPRRGYDRERVDRHGVRSASERDQPPVRTGLLDERAEVLQRQMQNGSSAGSTS